MQHLILAYQQTKDISTRNLIAKYYLYVASNLAAKTHAATGFDKDDLEQEAAMELIESIGDYNPNKNTKFSTFAYSRIVGRLQQFMRDKANLIKIPQNLYTLNGKINKAKNALASKLMREPSNKEIILAVDIDAKEYYDAQVAMLAFNPNIVAIEEIDIADVSSSFKEEIEETNITLKLDAPGMRREAWVKTLQNESSTKQ